MQSVLSMLFTERETARSIRNLEEESVLSLLSPLFLEGNVTALLPYKNPLVSALIQEAKYYGSKKAHLLLGKVLASYLSSYATDEAHEYVLVPIPLSSRRLKERGYNQAERITSSALAHLKIQGVPSTHLLERIRDTESQTHLPRKVRLKNMESAFRAQELMPSRTYILIDDVVTTGATFAAATSALNEAGATQTLCVALAH